MASIKTKAIFYAYSNNALDHLAPYTILCHQKKMDCVVIFGEDYLRYKVYPKNNIIKIFEDQNINIHNIPRLKKGTYSNNFLLLMVFGKHNGKKKYIPNYLKSKVKGLCNRVISILIMN